VRRSVSVAFIDESKCIGCTHCRKACPVDCITGAHQFMHTIISSECTGCKLCISPCPVDCISMVPADEQVAGKHAKLRIQFRNARLKSAKAERQTELRKQKDAVLKEGGSLISDILQRKKR